MIPTKVSGINSEFLEEIDSELTRYFDWGFTLFPLRGSDRLDKAKIPACKWKWLQRGNSPLNKTTDRFARAAEKKMLGGIGAVTGPASQGLCVRDFDIAESYLAWKGQFPDLAEKLPTSKTSRGYHVYAKSTIQPVRIPYGDGEFIGDSGHFVVMPPSLHDSGYQYRWINRPESADSFLPLDPREAGFLVQYSDEEQEEPEPTPHTPLGDEGGRAKKRIKASVQSVDLAEYSQAISEIPDQVKEAVFRCLPQRQGERTARICSLVSSLKELDPESEAPDWFIAFVLWWRHAKTVVKTKDFDQSWNEFYRAWRSIQRPSSMAAAKTKARVALETSSNGNLARTLAVARSMADGEGKFFLSCRTLADLIGVSHRTAATLLNTAVSMRFLTIVDKGTPSATKRVATRFRLGENSCDPGARQTA